MKNKIIDLPRWTKQLIAMTFDIICVVLATWLAYCLRLEEWHSFIAPQKSAYVTAVILAIPIFYRFGVYKTVLRYTGSHSLMLMGRAVAIYSALYFAAIFMLASPYIYRSIGLVQPFILFMLMALGRIAASLALGFKAYGINGRPVLGKLLIYGAGHSGMQIATALRQSGQYYLVAYIDDSPQYHGNSINGLTVFAPTEIPRLIETHGISDILLAMPSINRARRYEILQNLRDYRVHVRSLPDLVDLARGRITVLDIKELAPDDLLGRPPIEPSIELVEKNIRAKTILVSGAGGSIGSELCRQVLKAKPKTLLLLDHSEYNLYAINAELTAHLPADQGDSDIQIIPLLGNVRDLKRLESIFSKWQINTVYHAAAYKHVPLVENNPVEGIDNNIIGTLNLAETALKFGVENFVLISTDKAVRPTNVMGASKRFAEMILQALANIDGPKKTCFSMVRFGNVLDSSGSVVPLFREQIRAGGPITLTHLEVTRYFMTIPEGAQLVIQAGAMAKGGEVFVLDMGQPVKIYDLARRMIQLSGLNLRDANNPHGDIEIILSGLRPGEKLYEELLIGENPMATSHPRIMMAKEDHLPWKDLSLEIAHLRKFLNENKHAELISQLKRLVHGFKQI